MMVVFLFCVYIREEARQRENLCYQRERWLCWVRINAKQKQEKKEKKNEVHIRARFRSWDLWVMGPPRFRCATLIYYA